jgi:phage shock protein C
MAKKHLYRSSDNKILGGVCGGLGEYFDIDPVFIRLIVALLVFTGISILFYIIAWVIIPENPQHATGKTGAEEIKEKAEQFANEIKKEVKKSKVETKKDDGRLIIGVAIIILGLLFLLQDVFGFHAWSIFWPLVLVVIGITIILNDKK